MGVIQTGPGSPLTVSTASGGKTTAINNVSTSTAQVVAANPARQKITFHNPGANILYVAMAFNAVGAALVPTLAALGGTFQIFPGGLLEITGECQMAWQALAASGSTNPLTIMESNT